MNSSMVIKNIRRCLLLVHGDVIYAAAPSMRVEMRLLTYVHDADINDKCMNTIHKYSYCLHN